MTAWWGARVSGRCRSSRTVERSSAVRVERFSRLTGISAVCSDTKLTAKTTPVSANGRSGSGRSPRIEVTKVCGSSGDCPSSYLGSHAYVVTLPGRIRPRTISLRSSRTHARPVARLGSGTTCARPWVAAGAESRHAGSAHQRSGNGAARPAATRGSAAALPQRRPAGRRWRWCGRTRSAAGYGVRGRQRGPRPHGPDGRRAPGSARGRR
jgi:hypothetical protein